jgi:hypothetical protein
MEEKWTAPLPKKENKQGEKRTVASAVAKKKTKKEEPRLPEKEEEVQDDLLAGSHRQDVPRLEQYLKEICFLDPTLGVHEQLQSRDPMLIVLESPSKPVIMKDGTQSTVIDDLIKSGDRAFRMSCGSAYEDFELIQYTVQACLASKDFHAKQMLFLGMMAIDRGLHDQFLASYPIQQAEVREASRFEPFMKNVVKPQLDAACNTMYVNVPVPTRFNVDHLLRRFLSKCVGGYPG